MSEAAEFKPGDVVALKSDGPKMTIDKIGNAQYEQFQSAWCSWFDDGQACHGVYPLTSLRRVVEGEGSSIGYNADSTPMFPPEF